MNKSSFPTVSRLISLKNASRLVKNPIPVVEETMEKLGPTYFFHLGGKTKGMITKELDIIQHILQKNSKNYHKSPLQSRDLAAYVGKGLLTNNGESWLRQRRLIQPAFSRKNINSLTSIIEEEVRHVIEHEVNQNRETNISHLSAMLTFHIVARAIFSDEVSHEEIVEIRDNVERVQKMLILQVRQPLKRWYYHLFGMIRRHHELADKCRKLILTLAKNRKQSGTKKEDILQFLLDTRYEDTGEPMHLEQLTDELLILMVAGHETTAHSLTWTLFLLNQHPEVYTRLLSEIDSVGTNYMEYFKPQSYLMSVIKESMRLYPPAWVIDRIGIMDDEVQGNRLPADTIIMCFIYGLHRSSLYWKDPTTFNPDRFMSNEKHKAYLPFGAGPRLCIGNHFAYLELVVTLYQLLSQYILPTDKIPFPGIRPLITLQPASQIRMTLSRR